VNRTRFSFASLCFIPVILSTGGAAIAQVEPPARGDSTIVVDSLVARAVRDNPDLRAARLRAQAGRARIAQAGAWDAPQVGVALFKTPVSSFPNPLLNGMETDYSLQQRFPFPGKLASAGEAAERDAAMLDEESLALERILVRDLKTALYDLSLVQRKIDITAENEDLVRRFVEIASKKYEVGTGQQPDILRAQTELSTLVTDGVNLEREKRIAEAKVNTLLDRSPDAPLGIVPESDDTIPAWTAEELRAVALANRPELKAMEYGVEMRKAQLERARREYYPDLLVGVMYKDMIGTSDDFWSTMFGVSIPVAPWANGKFSGREEESALNVRKAEEELRSVRNAVLLDVEEALVKVRADRSVVLLYRNATVPQAQQTLQSTIAAYETGRTEFLMLIDAYRVLLNARLGEDTAVRNYRTSLAELERAVGLTIPDIVHRIPK
jgi:cobalt-zinc-cadmium efflux system outer membrane protein